MNLRPDFDRTATGYPWLDTLTAPFWNWLLRRAERRFEKDIGVTIDELGIALTPVPPLENLGFEEGYPWQDLDSDELPILELDYGEFPPPDFLIPYQPDTDDNRPPDRRP